MPQLCPWYWFVKFLLVVKAACIWIFLTNFHLNTWLKNLFHFASNTIPLVGREGLWQKLYYIQCLCFQCGKEEEVNKAPISIFRKLPSFPRIPAYFPSCAPWDTRQVHNINYNDFRINTNIGARCYNAIFLFLEHVADVREMISNWDDPWVLHWVAFTGFSQSINTRALPLTTHPSLPIIPLPAHTQMWLHSAL